MKNANDILMLLKRLFDLMDAPERVLGISQGVQTNFENCYWGHKYFIAPPPFAYENLASERLSNLPRVTQPARGQNLA